MMEFFDDIFHACALAAFVDQAIEQQGWPDSKATQMRAYSYFEQELRHEN